MFDIAIDLRRDSKNFGKAYKFNLKEKNILYIPKGFAHGYLSLSSQSVLIYYMTNYRNAKNENGIVWNDKRFKIKYPTKNIIISAKDKKLNTFNDFLKKYKSL